LNLRQKRERESTDLRQEQERECLELAALVEVTKYKVYSTWDCGQAVERQQYWTEEEAEALIQAVEVLGVGNWANMKKDDRFALALERRTNVMLKDKYRNLLKLRARSAAR
jgi:hypothetical protein